MKDVSVKANRREHFKQKAALRKGRRLQSLDFFRGLIMILLVIESTHIYSYLIEMTRKGSLLNQIFKQFQHHPWHGLRFWDLIQPGFMFIAGTAMAFSLTKQTLRGRSWVQQFKKALKRSWWLLFWGILDYAVQGDHLAFELWDVLTQLSFTLLLAFLIFKWKIPYQIIFSFGLLLLTEFLYRYINIPGFNQPFTDQHNFGNYIDLILMNKTNPGGWVAINAIPTAAHTIWGVIAGKWLLTSKNDKIKIKQIMIFGIILLLSGYMLDFLNITPIIKRISTSSFTLVTGGYCLLSLAALYWWIDVLNHKRYIKFYIIVGINPIFIYLFFEIIVQHWLYDYNNTIVTELLGYLHVNINVSLIIAAIVLFLLQWYLCYWLYKKKIFFKV